MRITIKTGSWYGPIPPDHVRIGISRGIPSGMPAGYRVLPALAPGLWFNSVTSDEYDRRYHSEILALLDPLTIVSKIEELAAGRTPVLCCFEKPDGRSWCHRSMAAQWIANATGHPVPELRFETLAQANHPMLPRHRRVF